MPKDLFLNRQSASPSSSETHFTLHLASPPLLPLSEWASTARWVLIGLLASILIWRAWPKLWEDRQFWLYLLIFAATLFLLQTFLKSYARTGLAVPMIFQFVVVFHYFSWYVFSFDKLRELPSPSPKAAMMGSRYNRLLASLRSTQRFAIAVIVLTLISIAGVFWYYRFDAPAALRYAFDYNYFLYFLVFHVTFSFNPKKP